MMTREDSRRWVAVVSMALCALLGITYWNRGDSSGHGPDAVARSAGTEAATPPPEVNPSRSQSGLSLRQPLARKRGADAKGENLALALEQRPPALVDRRTEISSDPERQRRYSERAARAERLNRRLERRIEDLENTLATPSGVEQSAIQAELQQLRANLSKRQALEHSAMPAPGARSGS